MDNNRKISEKKIISDHDTWTQTQSKRNEKKIEPMEGKNITQERKYSAAYVAFKGKFITLHFLLEEYVLKSMIYFLLKELEEKCKGDR